MNADTPRRVTEAAARQPIQDEWGAFDPDRTGATPAVMRVVPQPAGPAPVLTPPRPAGDGSVPAPGSASALKAMNDGALYTLEAPVRCPECHNEIRTLRVLRVLRTQVSFTSTLPRKGYVIVCPQCERLLSAELSGLV